MKSAGLQLDGREPERLHRKEAEIVISLPVTGGAYSQNLVLAAMETVASTSDNREKLAMRESAGGRGSE
jgi:hypothetical protein